MIIGWLQGYLNMILRWLFYDHKMIVGCLMWLEHDHKVMVELLWDDKMIFRWWQGNLKMSDWLLLDDDKGIGRWSFDDGTMFLRGS